MIDFREIQIVDKSFELTETIAQNEALTKKNNQLFYLVLASSLLIIGASIYFYKQSFNDDSKNKNI